MTHVPHVLHVEDSEVWRDIVEGKLLNLSIPKDNIIQVVTLEELKEQLGNRVFDLVILDGSFPTGRDGQAELNVANAFDLVKQFSAKAKVAIFSAESKGDLEKILGKDRIPDVIMGKTEYHDEKFDAIIESIKSE